MKDKNEEPLTKETKMKAEKRLAERKELDPLSITELTSLSNYQVIAHSGTITDASITGFLIQVSRQDLASQELKSNLTLDALVNQQVVLYLPQMNLDLDGRIIRTAHLGKGIFELAIEFSQDVPEYWRECLVDLLPAPGELSEST